MELIRNFSETSELKNKTDTAKTYLIAAVALDSAEKWLSDCMSEHGYVCTFADGKKVGGQKNYKEDIN